MIRADPEALLAAALDYAGRGWRVLPCQPGDKRPHGKLCPHWRHDSSTDPEVITRWWTAEPHANIGLVTGLAFDVLDIDGPEALDALERSGPIGDPDLEGPVAATPRGWHCYVKPTGRGNAVNLGGLHGIDWRGHGGYAIAPPSAKDDGGTWEWMTGSPLDLGPDTPIMAAPEWVLSLFDRSPDMTATPGAPTRHAGRTGYGAAALERELGKVLMAPEGARNDQLNRAAFALGRLAGADELVIAEIGDSLLSAALRIGLARSEALATIKSGIGAALDLPDDERRRTP